MDKQEQKGVGMLKSHQLGFACKSQKGGGVLFIGKAGSHCVILLYYETLLLVLLGLLFYMFEFGKAKSATQGILMKK